LSLEELQEIGAEAGIDPAHIALAATELMTTGTPTKSDVYEAFLGMPTRIGTSRLINGHVTDDDWEQMVFELRGVFGRDGIAGEIGRVREWTVTSSMSRFDHPVKVTLTPEGNDTQVTISQEMRGQAKSFSIATGIYLLFALMIGLVSVLISGENVPPIGVAILFLGMAVVFFGGAQIGTRLYARRQRAKIDRALDRIELVAREAELGTLERENQKAAERQVVDEIQAPQIDLDALREPEDIGKQRDSGSRTHS